jgi:hypothetical protein
MRSHPRGPVDHSLHAQTMRRLRICIGVLSALLLASAARAVVDGLTPARGLAVALTVVLLVAALALWRQGSRHGPRD